MDFLKKHNKISTSDLKRHAPSLPNKKHASQPLNKLDH